MKLEEAKPSNKTTSEMSALLPGQQQMTKTLSRANHAKLTDIFQKIGNKDVTKEGLVLLYDFIRQHPEADIEPFLTKSSQFFQEYIRQGLNEIEEERKKNNKTSMQGNEVVLILIPFLFVIGPFIVWVESIATVRQFLKC